MVFRSLDRDETLVFVKDEASNITYMATSRYPAAAYLRLAWYDAPA